MGSRMVVGFQEDTVNPIVWLYCHGGGDERVSIIASSISAAKSRWCDPHYATRIAISSIIGSDWDQTMGYGISAGDFNYCSPDYEEVHLINWAQQSVSVIDSDNGKVYADFGFDVFLSFKNFVQTGEKNEFRI